MLRSLTTMLIAAAVLSGCGSASPKRSQQSTATLSGAPSTLTGPGATGQTANIYSHAGPGALAATVQNDPALVYVPNSMSNTVTVISQRTFKVVRRFSTGELPQHVTPSWDLKTLYVDNDVGNSLLTIDPHTGAPGRTIPVTDPYNLYFTPDGGHAIVVAERLQQLDFRDPHSMTLQHSLAVPACRGIDHMDFSADGRSAFASCEFAGRLIKVDLRTQKPVGSLVLGDGTTSPQDVKLSPDGRTLFAADQLAGGVWKVDPARFRVTGFLHTGAGAHGLYPSRDAKLMYVSNRRAASVSVVSFKTQRVLTTWTIPSPASPDMGGVSADGSTLWLSGRYDAEVYAINTQTGALRARIPVGAGPHGLSVWPQPGRFSLGHTGITR